MYNDGMNIFVLDSDPHKAAEYHCDKHVVKMILESAQLLSSAHHLLCSDIGGIYKLTHRNHPCAIWTRESSYNYEWLLELSFGLVSEYRQRYGNKEHKTETVLNTLRQLPYGIPDIGLTPFVQAMSENYQNEDAVSAYRSYYLSEKSNIAKWKHGNIPDWWRINETDNSGS